MTWLENQLLHASMGEPWRWVYVWPAALLLMALALLFWPERGE